MIKLITGPQADEQFLRCEGFGEFRFSLIRRDLVSSSPSYRYIVYSEKFVSGCPRDPHVNRQLCLAYMLGH